MASAARVFNTLPQVGSNIGPVENRGANRVPFEVWEGQQITRNGKIAGRLTVVKPDDWLSHEDNEKLRRRAHALKLCSRQQWVQLLSDGSMELASVVHCHDRLCGLCAARRSRVWQDRVQTWMTPDGRTRCDANGRLKGNRTAEEIMAALDREVLRLQQTIDDPAVLRDAIDQAWDRAGREMVTVERPLHQQFVTLTIPNVEHVWMLGIGRDVLDGVILTPFRQMMAAIKRRRNRAAGRRVGPVTRKQLRRAVRRMQRRPRRAWRWKRPRGRHYVLGIGYLTRIRGYIAALEITHHPKTGYHPHLHLLTWATRAYVGQGIVRHVWRHYTRNAAIQAVKVVKAAAQTVGKELVKYLTKVEKTTSAAVREIERALWGRRAIWTGGIAYGVRWSKQKAEEDRMARLTAPPLAEQGEHQWREWDPKTQTWTARPLRDDTAELPVKTAEQWANPLAVTPDGERTRRPLAEAAAQRDAVRHQTIPVHTPEEREHRYWAEDQRERQGMPLGHDPKRGRPRRRWQLYVALLVWSLLAAAVCPENAEAGLRQILGAFAEGGFAA
ncbi:protein rep [Sulfobacillus harzensis]|uniref:Protein rep n=1 Tax=Sulfobacillus harzensis TaxID=2729629 RepID=A0A7Y0Q593_9FIRM|nr:protein rep [Sulfobacillus harzensis]NMP24034.1 protein rep [Sulfobacillus harzensis]